MWYTEFKKLTTNSIGRINPRSVTEHYFCAQSKLDLWNTFIENTKHLEAYSYHDRIKFLDAGIFNEIPKCYCGNEVTILDRKVSKFCSKTCALKSDSRKSKISETKKNQDHKKINDKRIITMREKYGVEYNSQRSDIKHLWTNSKLKEEQLTLLNDYDWMFNQYITLNKSGVQIGEETGIYYGSVLSYCRKHGFEIKRHYNTSKIELEIVNWIKSLGFEVEQNRQDLLSGKLEIDCYIPSKNIGIEINGMRWHTEEFCSHDKHLIKTEAALKNNIDLIHITDHDWLFKKEIIKSIIKSRLGLNEKIYARKCILKEVDSTTANKFLSENHIQGKVNSSVKLGLYHNNELVMLATFGRPRFNNKYEWELLRFCSKLNYSVVGGFSKLISNFTEKYSTSLFSYVDRHYFNGSSYVNWKLVNTTSPGYFWTDSKVKISRFKTQKKQLEQWLESYDKSKSEVENMIAAGYFRYFDCGNLVFEYKKDDHDFTIRSNA